MLPTVDFCGLNPTRLVIGANPFGGFSHQGKERNQEMLAYSTVENIKETWKRGEAAGINTMVTNNESPNVLQAVEEYLAEGGKLQWIAQLNTRQEPNMFKAIDKVAEIGCKAIYFHGVKTEEIYVGRDVETGKSWADHVHSKGIPVGFAGHSPEEHMWVYETDLADFHVVCFFNCGSLHQGRGEKFQLGDVGRAVAAIQKIQKPCIGYKIMGAGRIDPKMAFQYAYEQIKPTDIVNVGMYRGDKDDMVEENVALASEYIG